MSLLEFYKFSFKYSSLPDLNSAITLFNWARATTNFYELHPSFPLRIYCFLSPNLVFSSSTAIYGRYETMHLKNFFRQIRATGQDDNFLSLVHNLEKLVSKVLSIAMLLVIIVATIDLGILLITELFSEPVGFFNITLIELFGLFLNILVALELLENITAYLEKNVIQVELVIVTSLIAVARKLIILDLGKTSGIQLVGLAIAIFALSISYWIVRGSNNKQSH